MLHLKKAAKKPIVEEEIESTQPPPPVKQEPTPEEARHKRNLEKIKELVVNKPEEVAALVREWLAEE